MNQEPKRGQLFSVADAAREIGVSSARVYAWIKEGRIVPRRVHSRALALTRGDIRTLKRIPRSGVGRPRISDSRG